jgi:hypothetical protein
MMRRSVKWLVGVFALAVAAVGAALVWHQLPERHRFYTDADTIRQSVESTTPRDILWQPPVKLSEVLNTTEQDYEPRLSWDGLTLYFVRGKAGENADILFAKRTPTGWTDARPVEEINTEYDDLGPEPAPDGCSLYFYSDRPGGAGGYDLWVAQRGASGWQTPINLGPAVNSEFNDYGPALTPDGKTLYFASNRPRPTDTDQPDPHAWPATVREDLFHRTYDLYCARLTDAGPSDAEALVALNTRSNEGAPCVSPAGDFVYFASDRSGGMGGFDLYRARRLRGGHEPPANLGAPVNTVANELDPGLTHIGYALYFSSDRAAAPTPAGKPNDYDLYFTSAREVFTEIEQHSRPPIDWAALLRGIWPFLLWLLVALLILLLLRALMGSVKDRKLSLLIRCLLASLLAHALLMLLFSFWEVTASLSNVLRRGGVQVALGTPARADELTTQIRGQLTAVNAPPPAQIEARRADMRIESEVPDTAAVVEIARIDSNMPEQSQVADLPAEAPEPTSELALSTPQNADVERARLDELALPTETRRIDSPERQTPVQPRPRPASPVRHADITLPTTQPIRPPVAVALRPQRADAPEPRSERFPPDVASETADAGAPPASSPTASTRVVLDRPPKLTLALPAEAPRPARDEPAKATQVRAVTPVPVRARLANTADAPEHDQAWFQLAPARRPGTPDDSSIAAPTAEPLTGDASPAATIHSGPQGRNTNPAAAQALELELPKLEQPQSAHQAERPPSVATAEPTGARPGIATAIAQPSAQHRPLVDVTPTPRRLAAEEANASADPPVNDAPSRLAYGTPPAPSRVTESPASLALELGLPTETEPPAARQARTGSRDASRGRPPAGTIRGRVTDIFSGDPLPGAVVRLDLPDVEPLKATSDEEGLFALPVPRLPDHVALTASRDGYVPTSVNVPAWRLRGSGLTQDFELEPETDAVVAIEAVPEVHHLGNNRWEGRINSQFQKRAEGRILRAYLGLSAEQVAPHVSAASVALLAKGVQCPHRIYVNDHLLDQRLDESPADGSFGEFSASFDPELLIEGINVLEIRAVHCRGDLDDFEFVNIQLRLSR